MAKITTQQPTQVRSPSAAGKTERLPAAPEANPSEKAVSPSPASDLYAGEVGPTKAEASAADAEVPKQAESAVSTAATTPDGKPAATGEPLSSELRKLSRAMERVSSELARQGDPQLTAEVKAKVDTVLAQAPEVEGLIAERRKAVATAGAAAQDGGSLADLDARIDAAIQSTTATLSKSDHTHKEGDEKPADVKHAKGGGSHLHIPNSSSSVVARSADQALLLQQQDQAQASSSATGDVADDASIDDIIRAQKTTPMDPSDPLAAFYVPPEQVAESRAFACEPFASFTWNLIEHKSEQILELEQPLKDARKEIKQLTGQLAEAREVLSDAKEQLKSARELGADSPECTAALTQVQSAKETVETLDAKLGAATEKAEGIEARIQTYSKTQSILMEVFKMFIDFLMQDIYRRNFG